MIILAALSLFLLFTAASRLTSALRKRTHRPTASTPKGRAAGKTIAEDELALQVSGWTDLDDIQLNRLLRDCAPH